MEVDERDRQKEREELEEIRKKLLDDGHPDPEAEMERVCESTTVNTRHHHGRVAGEGCGVVAPPCPWSTACLQRSPVRQVESFCSCNFHT